MSGRVLLRHRPLRRDEMKKVLVLIAAISMTLLAACSSSGASGSVQTVDPQAWLQTAAAPGVTVIDVRTPAEFAAAHVDGAINLDVEGAGFTAGLERLDKNRAYALYCHSGRRSTLAADAMAGAGFTSVTNLQGGIADLQAAGATIVSS